MKLRIKKDFFYIFQIEQLNDISMKKFLIWKQKNNEIYVTCIKVSKILLQFVLFYDTFTVYAENKRKRQNLQILVFTGVGLLEVHVFASVFTVLTNVWTTIV